MFIEDITDGDLVGATVRQVVRWDVLEFLARVLDHLPDPSQQLLRYWGWYSNAARGRRLRQQASRAPSPARAWIQPTAKAGSGA